MAATTSTKRVSGHLRVVLLEYGQEGLAQQVVILLQQRLVDLRQGRARLQGGGSGRP